LSAEQTILSAVQFSDDVDAHILLPLGDMLDLLVQLFLRPASSWRSWSFASVVLATEGNRVRQICKRVSALLAMPAEMTSVLYERLETRVPSGERGWEANGVLKLMQIKKLPERADAGC
jgi:hypothetical protein